MFLHAAESRCGHGRLNEAAKLAGCFRKFNHRKKKKSQDYIDALAECIQRMRLSLNDMVEMIAPPWNRLQPGANVVLVVGKRTIPNPHPGEEGTLQHYAIGARDAEVVSHLTDFIQRDLQRDCRIKLAAVSAGALKSRSKRMECLSRLLSHAKRGALICIGSPVVNPLTDLVAEWICDGNHVDRAADEPTPPPAQFVWPTETWEGLNDSGSYLTCPTRPTRGAVLGIRLRGRERTLPVRDSDTTIRQKIDDHEWRGAPFKDCGLLMADTSDANRILALCAGHGGLGTLAASHALTSRAFGGLLERSENATAADAPPLWCVGSRRVMQVINVTRKKPTSECFDDLTLESDPWEVKDVDEFYDSTAWNFFIPMNGKIS